MEYAVLEYFYDLVIKRKKVNVARNDEVYGRVAIEKGWIDTSKKWLNVHYKPKQISTITEDKIKLNAQIYLNEHVHHWAILTHGYGGFCEDLADVVHQFINHGFNVVCPDLRGHGKSEGESISFGWLERLDMKAWCKWISEMDENAKIVLYGQSMGATCVMNATGEQLMNVKCCIADSGFSSVERLLDYQLKEMIPCLSLSIRKYLLFKMNLLIKARCGYSIYEARCSRQLTKSKIPTLFIHGTKDNIVPTEMVYDNYYSCRATKELLLFEASHTESCLMEDYYNQVFKFVDKFL